MVLQKLGESLKDVGNEAINSFEPLNQAKKIIEETGVSKLFEKKLTKEEFKIQLESLQTNLATSIGLASMDTKKTESVIKKGTEADLSLANILFQGYQKKQYGDLIEQYVASLHELALKGKLPTGFDLAEFEKSLKSLSPDMLSMIASGVPLVGKMFSSDASIVGLNEQLASLNAYLQGPAASVSATSDESTFEQEDNTPGTGVEVNANSLEEALAMHMISPLEGPVRITSQFGPRTMDGKKEHHNGIDVVPMKTSGKPDVFATFDGKVARIGSDKRSGNYIVLEHEMIVNGKKEMFETMVAHLDQKAVLRRGDVVKQGDVIGVMGNTGRSTGAHVHFEIRYNDRKNRYVDPASVIAFNSTNDRYIGQMVA